MSDGYRRGPYRPTGLPPNGCAEAVEGVHEHCCHHDLPDDHKHAPGSVCCWCGDIYLPDYEPTALHGEYKPKTRTVPKGSPRGFERIRAGKRAAAKVRKGAP